MISITLDNIPVSISDGSTLLNAAAQLGLEIPTMCHNGELDHFTSCMLCMVKDTRSGKLIPSCSARAQEGMEIVTDDNEIKEARKIALELLLSEHAGDCEAPCRVSCPAFMNIPLMNRLIAAGQHQQALEVVMRDIALPGVLGRICPAPCEGSCKRKPIDDAVSICLLKRFTSDQSETYPVIIPESAIGKKVAIIGAGPAGLSAAYYLQKKGVAVTIFDANPLPGGALQYEIGDDVLDRKVLAREAEHIFSTGVSFIPERKIDKQQFEKLRLEFEAVVVAIGNYNPAMNDWGLENNGKQLTVDKGSYMTNLEKVFAIGNVNRPVKLAIRSAAQGKEVAVAILQMFQGQRVIGEIRTFNSTLGRLMEVEHSEYIREGSNDKRQKPQQGEFGGYDILHAQKEAARCLHCDCRKAGNCKLRDYAHEYGSDKKRFTYTQRKPLKKVIQQGVIIYEPGKCIKCGICVRLTAKHQEEFGFTFIGRGFDVEIGIPFNHELGNALAKTARLVADECPTGALSRLDEQIG